MEKKKILLLNPPGKEKYIRDYYCSKTTKSNYLFHPIDLLITSGWLKKEFNISFIDAIVDNLTKEQSKKHVIDIAPDIIVFLSGAVSFEEDYYFLSDLNESLLTDVKFIGSGDIFLENGEEWFDKWSFLNAVILSFFNGDILYYLQEKYDLIESMIYKTSNGIKKVERNKINKKITFPTPMHELFQNKKYQFSFLYTRNFATVLTDYGCPFKCSFCVIAPLSYCYRSSKDVLKELQYIKKLGIEEIFFFDQTFGVNQKRLREICDGIIENKFNFRWVCYCRPDIVSWNMLSLMKKAGCHTVMMGVETADEAILKKYNKGYSLKDIKKGFKLAKEVGLKTVGTFILGLPEENRESCENTIRLSIELDCDYASFNVAVPRMSTGLRREAIKAGLIEESFLEMDQAGKTIAMGTSQLSREELSKLHKKAIYSFFLRPSFILKRLLDIKSYSHLKKQMSEGFALLKNAYSK